MNRCTFFCSSIVAIIALTIGTSSNTTASTDNSNSQISLSFGDVIDIAQVDDITITDPTPGQNAVGIDEFCVAGTGFSNFSITFESVDGVFDPAFIMTDGNINVPYSVGFDNGLNGSFHLIGPRIPFQGNLISAQYCDDNQENVRFAVTILSGVWQYPPVSHGGPYHDTLMITVASE
ncbi:hypothetical protein MO867_15245 [Microbulbifer sp. OS29]|uniref:Spore coat protein U (SCPU) domain-containing protein n=1 Tax=Microbulbifer okhotskensis TaxID=2926617 RepID=A0A9X2ETT9_9GAMM|nr:hypothetical protein [Microbulbifer okhotskensis]MCO1335691.1 hypothetical protein [Microbulbifer okhotskensis]